MKGGKAVNAVTTYSAFLLTFEIGFFLIADDHRLQAKRNPEEFFFYSILIWTHFSKEGKLGNGEGAELRLPTNLSAAVSFHAKELPLSCFGAALALMVKGETGKRGDRFPQRKRFSTQRIFGEEASKLF